MYLEGSCHCGAVRFSVESRAPHPFMRCYCSICRKTTGCGGYAINLSGEAKTLKVRGKQHVRVYRAMLEEDGKRVQSEHQRHFCVECGSHLWAFHPAWPELIHPVAGAIDTKLPRPSEYVHMMLDSRAAWVAVEGTPHDTRFDAYPDLSLAEWHERHGVYEPKSREHAHARR
jgi:hypothetical protein